MTPKSEFLGSAVAEYVARNATPPDELLRDLAEYTAGLGQLGRMQISPEQGTFMGMLAQLIRPQFAVEVGTFTGYSAICVARALAPGGRLLCCDISEEWTKVARDYWERAHLADRIELRLAPAAQTLRALPEHPHVDLAFIDADKRGYADYWAELVPRMRPGGVILVDNVLWSGRIVEETDTDPDTIALREFGELVRADARVEHVLVPIGDGLTMARRTGS
ncbi:MAG TPA: class I SAM-dependent methyltransferase [Sporichthyaceae bacterium]|jgi:caffeoyl-CoA O-methyltransferase|nr:class I SAM-dependent methyltransferase [Sporichthyaceae bacterium]